MDYQFTKLHSAATVGIDGYIVEVETDIQNGLPKFEMSGLADSTIKEAKERVRSAIINSGFQFPMGRIVVNLAPADLRKEGSHFDLVIALGILLSSNQVDLADKGMISERMLVAGELALDGSIRSVRGILPMTEAAASMSFEEIVIPEENLEEASLVNNIRIGAVTSLKELVNYLAGKGDLIRRDSVKEEEGYEFDIDFDEIIGQDHAKKGLVIACCGSHNLLMTGPPGSGKSMIAHRSITILPKLTESEAFEVRKIHSVAGQYLTKGNFSNSRPFRNPHHTTTVVGLVGGQNPPRPGEITLAHNGVLFLDELTEFTRRTLEVLRQPIEDRKVVIARGQHSVEFPCKFMLVAALNPCPCGYYGSNSRECTCRETDRKRYMNKLSGPFRDRFDLQIEVQEVTIDDMSKNDSSIDNKKKRENSQEIRAKIVKARQIQIARQGKLNSELSSKEIEKYIILDEGARNFIQTSYQELGLSMRAYHKILKVARTIADLEGLDDVNINHLAETLSYRTLGKYY